ncbi:MAG: hypothetical protein QW680_11115 [Pyrobaculum sp.]
MLTFYTAGDVYTVCLVLLAVGSVAAYEPEAAACVFSRLYLKARRASRSA